MNIQIQTAVPTRALANTIIDKLLSENLIACGQIVGPITSQYIWKGKLETSEEFLCLLKTRSQCYKSIEDKILTNHPYDTPEIILTEIIDGYPGYLQWIKEETSS